MPPTTAVFLEVSARKSHGLANGHVVRMAKRAGARMVLDSDAHEPGDLLTPAYAMKVARGAGLDQDEAKALLETGPTSVAGKSRRHIRRRLRPPLGATCLIECKSSCFPPVLGFTLGSTW